MRLADIKSEAGEFKRTEFTALRAEIDRRSDAQLKLISLALTAFGTLAGVAFTVGNASAKNNLLLILPILSACTGLMWLDHDRSIHRIGDYIRHEVWPEDLPTYEVRADHLQQKMFIMTVEFGAPVLLAFAVPAAAGLWLTHVPELDDASKVLQLTGLVCFGFYIVCMFYRFFSRIKNSATTRVNRKGK